ncbi:MAG: LysR family transcriptional regulator [Pseudomonadota bacterium]
MNPIEQLRAFAAVVTSGSFTAAASRLGLSPQLVSKYVKLLEEDLGVRLLNRTTRSVQPTETGRAFFERAVALIDGYDELRASLHDSHTAPRGLLKLTAPVNFGELHLVPVISAFLQRYPEISVDLHLTDRFVRLLDEGFDVAIRISALESSGLIARRLADAPILLCATPAYLERHGRPQRPEDLAHHACIIDTNFREPEVWRFKEGKQEASQRVGGRFRVNSAVAVRQLLLAGAGIARCPAFVVADALAAGQLVTLFDGALTTDYGIYAVYLENRHLPGKVRAFIDFTADDLRKRLAR